MDVRIFPSKAALAAEGARLAGEVIRGAIARSGGARIVVATGNSQVELIDALIAETRFDWGAVDVFHMDEYVGIAADHPSSFRYWVRTRVEERAHPRSTSYLAGDALDLEAEMARYSGLLMAAPIDLAFVGFGENGHIAFNDPPVADFDDPKIVKRVRLDDACIRQQAGEGHFPDPDSVPREALTVTCPGLFRASHWICCVPDARKAEAVRGALEGPISTRCPASLVRWHPHATVLLDTASAALLAANQ